jgi:hypothetical protein
MHEFKIVLTLEKGRSWPDFNWIPAAIKIDSVDVDDYKKTVTYLIADAKQNIQLEYHSKGPDETVIDAAGKILHDQTLEISAVYVDDILLNHQFLFDNSNYIPNYNPIFVSYCAENNITVITEAQSATKFWHNGNWTFEFEDNFWLWYFLLNKNSNEEKVNSLSREQINSYLGYSDAQIQSQLNNLKTHLL